MKKYQNDGPVNCESDFSTQYMNGKTVVITGGSKGIGEGYIRALAKAGAFIVNGDVDEASGKALESELQGSVKFFKCNVTSWDDQLALFQQALALAPNGRVDIVIANAGVSGKDSVHLTNIDEAQPEKPELKILDINLVGVMYTTKLALHHFRRQNAADPRDSLLILQGSLAGYLDLPGSVEYSASKFALRGMMRSLRQTEWQHSIRINYIGPWYIETSIVPPEYFSTMKARGVELAPLEGAVQCLMRIASDSEINGRSFAIVPTSIAPKAYVDIDIDDYTEGWLKKLHDMGQSGSFRIPTQS